MPGRKTSRRRGTVLDRTKLGEQDLILTVLAKEGDQFSVIAKGARKPGGRLAARTELFCNVDMLVSHGRGLGIVTEAEVIDAHAGVRGELDCLACASAMCEVARLTSYENVSDPFLHPLLERALTACEQVGDSDHLSIFLAAYVFKVLSHSGWRPVLDECVACGEESYSRFSVAAGGVLCESCSRDVAGAKPIDGNGIAWIKALIGSTYDMLCAVDVDGITASYLLGLSHEWAATHLDSRLRALEFFAGM